MPPLQLTPEEASDFPLDFGWLIPSPAASGRLAASDGRLWLHSDREWPILQIPGTANPTVEIRGEVRGEPAFLRGTPQVRGGANVLLVNDLRLGSNNPEASIVAAWPEFDYADDVVRGRFGDGAVRSTGDPIALPVLDDAPSMSLLYAPGLLEISLPAGAGIDEFETQLDGLQRLLTFAAQQPAVRRRLHVEDADGNRIAVYRGSAVSPRPIRPVDYRNFPIRLNTEGAQFAIERWWAALNELRPIPHLLAGLRYQAGYREADFLLMATSLDRLSQEWTSAPTPLTESQHAALIAAAADIGIENFQYDNRATFMARVTAMTGELGPAVWQALHVDRDSWLRSMRNQRNLVAHATVQRRVHRAFLTGLGLPALQAATDAVLTLIVAQYLGVAVDALTRIAERQYVLKLSAFVGGDLVLTNEGFEDRPREP